MKSYHHPQQTSLLWGFWFFWFLFFDDRLELHWEIKRGSCTLYYCNVSWKAYSQPVRHAACSSCALPFVSYANCWGKRHNHIVIMWDISKAVWTPGLKRRAWEVCYLCPPHSCKGCQAMSTLAGWLAVDFEQKSKNHYHLCTVYTQAFGSLMFDG